jgi:hypothetical protein
MVTAGPATVRRSARAGRGRLWRLFVGAALTAGVASHASAADVYARAFFNQSIGYDSNPNFSFDSSGSGQSLTTNSALSLNSGIETPAFLFDTNATVSYAAFPDNTNLNSVDENVGVTVARKVALTRYGVRGAFISDTTRTTDTLETGRFVDQNSRRYVLSAGPFIETQIDPLDTLSMSGTYLNQNRVSQNFPDYEQWSANALWSRILTSLTQFQVAMNGFVYNSNSSGSTRSQSIGVSAGFLHQFTPRLSARFLAGPVYSAQQLRAKQSFINNFGLSNNAANSNNSDVSYQIDSGLTYQWSERTDFGGEFTRSAAPSTTSGLTNESDMVQLFYNHNLLRQVSVGATASYEHRTAIAGGGGGSSDDVRDYVRVSPNLTWQLADDLRLSLNYVYRWQRREQTGDTTNSNGVFLAVNYELPRLLGER